MPKIYHLLKTYIDFFDQVYHVLLEENRYLIVEKKVPKDAFFDKKNKLLEELDTLSLTLNALSNNIDTHSENKTFIQSIQNKLMKLLILNKENEDLLFRLSISEQKILTSLSPISFKKAKTSYQS